MKCFELAGKLRYIITNFIITIIFMASNIGHLYIMCDFVHICHVCVQACVRVYADAMHVAPTGKQLLLNGPPCINKIIYYYCTIIIIQVHLCEAQRITDLLGDDFLIGRTGSTSMVVAVKTLRRDADDLAR